MSEFERLLDDWRCQRPGAFAALMARYLPVVRAVVRRQLSRRLRPRFDSHDFTQDVWASFFHLTLDRLDLPTEDALVGYLAKMAELKVAEQARHEQQKRKDVRRDRPLAEVPEPAIPATPSLEVQAGERWRVLTAGLSELELEMLGMIRDGHTHEVVAARFNLTRRTVQRLITKLRQPPSGEQ